MFNVHAYGRNVERLIAEILAVQRACWIAGDGGTGSDVTRHHATRTDNRIVTNGDSGQQNRASADPDVSANHDRLAALQAG